MDLSNSSGSPLGLSPLPDPSGLRFCSSLASSKLHQTSARVLQRLLAAFATSWKRFETSRRHILPVRSILYPLPGLE
jgi:hypothetical protein